ncbi:hypothetical protein ACSF83_03070 [Lactobacillus johnsonii]|jgi:hypothetical protein|uniref:hypothetical protein n=1 Tax=Lactobacillus johnsonii TaxID=33959 RepID=UPI00263657A3
MTLLNEKELVQVVGGKGGKVNWKAAKCQSAIALGALYGGLGSAGIGAAVGIAVGMGAGYWQACR